MKISVGTKFVDLAKCLPLTLGDQEAIDKECKGVESDVTKSIIYLKTIFSKGGEEWTLDHVRAIPLPQMRAINEFIRKANGEIPDPN